MHNGVLQQSLVLIIYDIQDAPRPTPNPGMSPKYGFQYVYKWKSFRNGMVNTEYRQHKDDNTRWRKEDRKAHHSNIFNSKRWVLLFPKPYQFINWTDNPFEVKS